MVMVVVVVVVVVVLICYSPVPKLVFWHHWEELHQ